MLETEVKLKYLRTPWKSKAMRESSKQKQKFNINFLNGKIQKMNLYTKITKTLRKIKEKVRANILSKHVRKTQRQCKTTMAGLERSYRKNSEEKSIFPNFTWNGKRNYIWCKLFTNVGPNLTNKEPQLSKTFDQYFSPFDTQIDYHDLTLKEFEAAYKSLKRNKASRIDDISCNIVLDFFEELKTSLFFEPRFEKKFFLTK